MTITNPLSPTRRRAPPIPGGRWLLAVSMSLACCLGGCAAMKDALFGPPTTKLESLTVIAAPDANRQSATAVDIVFLYDATLAALLPKNGPDWFAQKDDLRITLGRNADILHVSIAPKETSGPLVLPPRAKEARAVFSFANYLAPGGQPVADLTPYRQAEIRLKRDTVLYLER